MQTQNQVVEALLRPEAYPEDPKEIKLIQTHISYVFLTKKFVYKVKKAVNFEFLDFSTLEKRHFYCDKELQLNRRLCPDMYLEVVPINQSKIIKIKGDGETIEYALKMKLMPEEKIMTALIKKNKVDDKTINEIAKVIAQFHSETQTNNEISEYGSLGIVKTNWDENFSQTLKFVNSTISSADFHLIKNKIIQFMERNGSLFESRIKNGRIRDCHGDIHSGNIFIADKIYIFDAIEFNDRFRYSDVASDVAFLSMDLDFHKRTDLSESFINRYIAYSKDQQLASILPFYKCYRAYVRGKVISFRLDDPNVNYPEKEIATKEAQTYFKIAAYYAKNL
jgi:aminoglycoside phosphotransferase family enzyme